MTTKIVYAVVSSERDCYLESMWVSIYSLRIHNPDAFIVVLADDATAVRIRANEALLKLINTLTVVDVPQTFTPKERNREIKTSVRQHVEGAMLYIDNDTVVAGCLSAVDSLVCDVAAVPEEHLSLKDFPFRETVLGNMRNIFGEDCSDSDYWFNSGVIYAADSPTAHDLYKRWNENWRYSTFEKHFSQDQPALLRTNKQLGYIVTPLSGEYNCQVTTSIQYLCSAKILHFVHWGVTWDETISPFMGDALYKQIKADGGISAASHDAIKNVKTSFHSPSMIIGARPMLFFFSTTGQIFYQLHSESKRWEHFLDWAAGRINLYYRAKKKLRKYLRGKKN